PNGKVMANTWQGEFPWLNLTREEGTSTVGSYPPNGYGLFDMCGNVWEWTTDSYSPRHMDAGLRPFGVSLHSRTSSGQQLLVLEQHRNSISRRVVKGGSYLCAANNSLRYRPAARQGEPVNSSSSHVGFRCIVRADRKGEARLRWFSEHRRGASSAPD